MAELKERCPSATFDNLAVGGYSAASIRKKFETEVLGKGYDQVIVQGGINSMCNPVESAEKDMSAIYAQAKQAGMRVIAVSISPFHGYKSKYWTDEKCGANVLLYNKWILAKPANIDVLVDAYAALEDPSNPNTLRPEYHGADLLHPNTNGQRALSRAIYNAAYGG